MYCCSHQDKRETGQVGESAREIYMCYANSGQHMAAALTDNYDSHLSLIIMRLCIQFAESVRGKL